MASKVMVKIPVTNFGQVNKTKSNTVNGELVAVARTTSDASNRGLESSQGSSSENTRCTQLEQNIRFLQDQHQLMLTGLHKEIESLRNKNRELQFQLVFSKGSIPSSPSSPEEEAKHKVYSSPKEENITPLQIELLEKELAELKIKLQDVEGQKESLSEALVEEKKKLEKCEQQRQQDKDEAAQSDRELLQQMDDMHNVIRRLRRENSDLRNEIGNSSSRHLPRENKDGGGGGGGYRTREFNSYQSRSGGSQNQNRGGNGRYRGNGGYSRNPIMTPPHVQGYWVRGSRRPEHNTSAPSVENVTLPSLNGNGTQSSRRHPNNNHSSNQYRNGDGRKSRGGQNKISKAS